jgi:hypothetical protein
MDDDIAYVNSLHDSEGVPEGDTGVSFCTTLLERVERQVGLYGRDVAY